MMKEDLLKCMYTANIYAKDFKEGMRFIDAEDWDDPNSMLHVFEVKNVAVTKEKVTFEATAYDPIENKSFHFFHEIIRAKDEKPVMTVYFPTIEKGLEFGIRRELIRHV